MSPEQKISALALTFPALRGAPGVAPWNEDQLRDWLGVCSSGERQAALFVLSVWNHYDNKFDMHAAVSKWDDGNLAAFVAWARAPWWC